MDRTPRSQSIYIALLLLGVFVLGGLGTLAFRVVEHLYQDHVMIDRARDEGDRLKLDALRRFDELQKQQAQQQQAQPPQAPK